tara:strand:+ start:534 stop:692 length:159 start_codon:yes stop_codon:yes gene_type:complete
VSGYSEDQLEELRKLVDGEESDLYDVLSYVAFHTDLIPRILNIIQKVMIFLN